jgi:hypothetical protein
LEDNASNLIVYGGSAFIHFGLAAVAINVVFDSRSADEDREPRDWTAWLLSQPFGRTLTMVVGIGIVIGGLAFVFQAFKAEFRKSLMVDEDDKKWIVTLGHGAKADDDRGVRSPSQLPI